MRVPAAALLAALACACGNNPAFQETKGAGETSTSSSTSRATTDAPTTSSPTTSSTTTSGATELLSASTTTTATTDPTTTSDPTTSTTDTGTTADTGPRDPSCPDDPALIACYAFPGGEFTVLVDGAAGQHDGEMTGVNLLASVDPTFGNAADVNDSSLATVPDAPQLSPAQLTVAMFVWIKQGNVGTTVLLDKDEQYAVFYDSGKLSCRMRSDQFTGAYTELSVATEQWAHVACVHDGAALRMRVSTKGNTTSIETLLPGTVNQTSTGGLALARNLPDNAMKFAGSLDQILIYDRPLGLDELCQLAGPLCGRAAAP